MNRYAILSYLKHRLEKEAYFKRKISFDAWRFPANPLLKLKSFSLVPLFLPDEKMTWLHLFTILTNTMSGAVLYNTACRAKPKRSIDKLVVNHSRHKILLQFTGVFKEASKIKLIRSRALQRNKIQLKLYVFRTFLFLVRWVQFPSGVSQEN